MDGNSTILKTKIMRSITMTDFVLNINKIYLKELGQDFDAYNVKKLNLIGSYAKFLKQPLKLEMFIACDENGNVLEEPERRCKLIGFNEQHYDFDDEELKIYCEAKEKVLFEGFEIYILSNGETKRLTSPNGEFNVAWYNREKGWYLSHGVGKMIVEDLIKYSIELTSSALKQIGINNE